MFETKYTYITLDKDTGAMESKFQADNYPEAYAHCIRNGLTGVLCTVIPTHRQPNVGFVNDISATVIDGQHEVVHDVNQ
jgi:hypothetical protein